MKEKRTCLKMISHRNGHFPLQTMMAAHNFYVKSEIAKKTALWIRQASNSRALVGFPCRRGARCRSSYSSTQRRSR